MAMCRSCETQRALPVIQLQASARGRVREWRVQVCRDCWRVMETMLETASLGYQSDLPGLSTNPGWWMR
jgi:hypothetical protein